MWVSRARWEQVLTEAAELRGKLAAAAATANAFQGSLTHEQQRANKLLGRVKELESALLEANEKLYGATKTAASRVGPVDLGVMFEDEDDELVRQDRARAEEEGTTDALLAEEA